MFFRAEIRKTTNFMIGIKGSIVILSYFNFQNILTNIAFRAINFLKDNYPE
jgi:hypothetical protein